MHYVEPLTNREIDCLRLAAKDKTMRETAATLCIGVETVKTHRNTVLQKLGCRTIAGALMVAMQLGLMVRPVE